jgi:hypothetical protein
LRRIEKGCGVDGHGVLLILRWRWELRWALSVACLRMEPLPGGVEARLLPQCR